MNPWLEDATARVAAGAGLAPADLELDGPDAKRILDIARHASHDSGDRINAPLLCFLLGRAVERGTLTLEQAARLFPADG